MVVSEKKFEDKKTLMALETPTPHGKVMKNDHYFGTLPLIGILRQIAFM